MQRVFNTRCEINRVARRRGISRKWLLIAGYAIASASSAFGQVELYLDNNGSTGGYGSAGSGNPAVWDAAATIWNTNSTSTSGNTTPPGIWVQSGQTSGSSDFNIANFDLAAANFVNLTDTEDIGGMNFLASNKTTIEGSGTLNIGSGNANFTYINPSSAAAGETILVPVIGSGTITYAYPGTGSSGEDMNFLGDMTGFTGTLIIASDTNAAAGPANQSQLAIGSDLGAGATIQIDNNAQLTTEGINTNTITGVSNQLQFTLHAPITLNATNAANAQEWIGTSAGGSGGTYTVSTQTIMTLAGVISGNSGALNLGYGTNGGRGTIVLDNNETYTGNTNIVLTNTDGLVQMGVDNALPTSTVLSFGSTGTGTGAIAPLDLNGHVMTVAGLATADTNTTATGAGNIYNTSSNPASIVISGSTNTTFNGDIGDSNTNVNPFNTMAPYYTNGTINVVANSNISLTVNGPGVLALAPVSALSNGNEYSGNTVINGGGLVFGRSSSYASGTAPGSNYTINGTNGSVGTVTVNSGATLSSLPTTYGATPTYVGGTGGNIVLNSGASMLPGGAGTAGVLSTGNINFNSGASMTFDIANASTNDWIFINGNLNLDSSGPNHTININVPSGDDLSPGTYTLIYTAYGINWDGTNGFVLGTTPAGNDTFSLINTGYNLEVQALSPALQWDPSGQGPQTQPNGEINVNEGGGEWTDGTGSDGAPASTFYDYSANQETTWSNSTTSQVVIGSDVNQSGGQISLGSNIVVNSLLTFGQIAPGANYSITNNNGNSYTLTLGGGVSVTNSASVDGSPSAEIDVPIILAGSQVWEVDPSQIFFVTGTLTENDGTPSYTLTKTGTGELDLDATTGSIGGLNILAGNVVLGAVTTIGNATVTLNGGELDINSTGTFANTLAIGAAGGEIGDLVAGTTLSILENISTPYSFEADAGGNITFSGTIASNGFQVTGNKSGTVTFNGAITDAGALKVNGGDVVFNQNVSATSLTIAAGGTIDFAATNIFNGPISIGGAGSTTLNNTTATTFSSSQTLVTLTGTNSFTSMTISGGTTTAGTNAALTNAPITLSGGTLSIPGITTISNTIAIKNSPVVSDTVAVDLAGNISGSGTLKLTGPEFTLSGNNTNSSAVEFTTAGEIVHAASSTAFGTATIAFDADSTLDAQVDVSANAIRCSTTSGQTLTKIGSGTLALTGSASTATVAGSAIEVSQGMVVMENPLALGGTTSNATNLNITLDPGTELVPAWIGTVTRTSGSITLNNATIARPSLPLGGGTSVASETSFAAASAADQLTISGDSTIDEAAVLNTSVDEVLGFTNPVVVNTGSVLTLECDNTFGYASNDALIFRGPTDITANAYDSFTIQGGATITQTGPGEVRFGRTSSQGVAIIGGTPGSNSDAVIQAGPDFYMTDANATANEINTLLVVNGNGSTGLRIEAAMDATYVDPSTNPPASEAIGTTGLFGVDPYAGQAGHTIGNVFTILSPDRAAALSAPYTYTDANGNTDTITPQGTLTLAANDAGNATGLINAGPAAASAVSLALDNTSGSSGTHIYQIDPASPQGGSFANFAGLTVERTYSSGAAVTAQLLGNTKMPALSITGGASVDITNQALVVDPATGPAPTAQIAAYLAAAYDSGNWDGTGGIGSSWFTNGMALKGTSIGYAENDALPVPYDNVSNFFGGASGQPVDSNAVLVRYTWLGDLNLDGTVDASDLAMMGVIPTTGPEAGVIGWFDGDLNYDGKINADDWALFMLGNASQTGQLTSAVPEPGALGLIAAAGMLLRRRRRCD